MKLAKNDRRRPGKIAEMRPVCQWSKNADGILGPTGSLYNRYFLRPISIYVTWILVAAGIQAHTATIVMTIVGMAGIVFCMPHTIAFTVVGGICYFLFDVMDAVDGEIARWNESSSTKGLFLDQVSHVFIDYPSRAVPALHYALWKDNELFFVLAAATVISSLMGRAIREILFRINAEVVKVQEGEPKRTPAKRMGFFRSLCNRLKNSPLAMFPLVKPRVVHIATVVAIVASYADVEGCLIFVSWFYALYCTTRMLVEIPYYFSARIVDVSHRKTGTKNNYPI
jgi:phosphatidylglycerophosphate synthase